MAKKEGKKPTLKERELVLKEQELVLNVKKQQFEEQKFQLQNTTERQYQQYRAAEAAFAWTVIGTMGGSGQVKDWDSLLKDTRSAWEFIASRSGSLPVMSDSIE